MSRPTLNVTAKRLLTYQLQQQAAVSAKSQPSTTYENCCGENCCGIDNSVAYWILDDALDLVAQSHHLPVCDIAPSIRRLVLNIEYMDDNGDHLHSHMQVDQLVDLYVEVLEQVRQIALENGEWSNAPVTPLMFG